MTEREHIGNALADYQADIATRCVHPWRAQAFAEFAASVNCHELFFNARTPSNRSRLHRMARGTNEGMQARHS
eukprot:1182127-Alexandrium_andersonii.AAC.1